MISLTLFLSSCNKSNRFEIDTTKNRVNVKIQRFDKDLISLDSTNSEPALAKLYKSYAQFLPVYTAEVLNVDAKDTAAIVSFS